MERGNIFRYFNHMGWALFSLGDDGLSVLVDVSSDEFAELLLDDLDLEAFEIGQLKSALLLLDAHAESRRVES